MMRITFSFLYFLAFFEIAAQTKDSTITPVSVYITFDDGPTIGSHCLKTIIRQDSLPVTVFLVGSHMMKDEESRELFAWYRSDSLVAIANHSFSHAGGKYKKYYLDPGYVVADIIRNEELLELKNKIVRLPGRNIWQLQQRKKYDLADAIAAADSLSAIGYSVVGWDMEWCYDTSGKDNSTAMEMLSRLRYHASYGHCFTRNHIVILCHDPMLLQPKTRKEFSYFIEQVKADPGLRLQLISAYPITAEKPREKTQAQQ